MSSVKEEMTRIIQDQPDDSSFDEILRELALARMIDRGLKDSEAGRTISDDEMKRQLNHRRSELDCGHQIGHPASCNPRRRNSDPSSWHLIRCGHIGHNLEPKTSAQ